MKISKELMIKFFKNMVRVRELDNKMIECLMRGKMATFYHSCYGQEAPGVALCELLREDDYLFYQHRGHGIHQCLPRGMTAKELLAEHFGRTTGSVKGMIGFHCSKPEIGILGMTGMVGGDLPVAVGAAITCQMNGKGQISIASFGDGATGRGTMHESMLMASTWKLPVIFFCLNNFMAQFTRLNTSHPKEDLADFAYGYGMPSASVDGQDVTAVYEALTPAVERARAGEGPSFIEAKCLRIRGHVEGLPDHDVETENGVRPPEEIEEMKKRDPIELYKKVLLKKRAITKEEITKIHEEAKAEMDEAEKFAEESPWPVRPDFSKLLYAE